ncbi:dynactin subunit 4 [Coprinopsis sp. MPI-PUGE-AT-0042]|nr:dynactin subunit 4 [Coprinopsis sp. MPI-PUGE-AT-0042]
MAPSIQYHCPCLSPSPVPPPPHLPSSSHSFHPLHTLFFCEECDAVRCNRCVSVEVSTYFCPNCLFEVPSASVRAEKNRCARNCFMCPNCENTLSVVPSDPPESGDGRVSVVGEPPFFLYCNHCRWDSAQVGITFEKPTGLAAQLQRHEDSAPDSLEFDRLKEHFDPFLLTPLPSHTPHTHSLHSNSITAAASAALAREIPGVAKYNPLGRSTTHRGAGGHNTKDRTINKDEMPEYRARLDVMSASSKGSGGGDVDVDIMKGLETMAAVASMEQRWDSSWVVSLQNKELRPMRIPLHSKRSKRCPSCTHILIKPEQKAQSVRYKIKLVAANYLPAILVSLPHAQQALTDIARRNLGKSITQQVQADSEKTALLTGLIAGRQYPFHLAITNPLYDPITVRLSVQRVVVSTETGGGQEKARRPPFAISLPTSQFSIAAFAEAWEYDDDDEDMFGVEDDELGIGGSGSSFARGGARDGKDAKARPKTVGVLERKANTTIVGGEVVIGKEARGNVKVRSASCFAFQAYGFAVQYAGIIHLSLGRTSSFGRRGR